MNKFQSGNMPSWLCKTAFIAGIVFFALLVFYQLLIPGRCLFTTDDNLGMIPGIKNLMPQGFLGAWSETPFMGSPGGLIPIMWTPIFFWLMPETLGFNWIHAIDLILASIALALFLRVAGLHWTAIVLGAITAFWVGSNLTLTYAGHLGKFGVLIFAAASLYGLRKTFESDQPWLWAIVTGGALGFMLMEQQDLALFFGLFLGAYALLRVGLLFQKGMRLKRFLLLIPMGAVALIMSGANLFLIYTMNVSSIVAPQEENPRQKWEFATQWSWPPEESIDFIAPGYMGWRSGESDGPYWGRMGRSAGWEKTGQGFMNFKLENQYFGVIPLIFAFFAILAAFLGGKLRKNNLMAPDQDRFVWPAEDMRTEIYFWFFAAVLALLLSFGKYFPFYELFYQLPLVSNIRNPNKFLQIFQLATGILAAYGAHLAFNWGQDREGLTTDIVKPLSVDRRPSTVRNP